MVVHFFTLARIICWLSIRNIGAADHRCFGIRRNSMRWVDWEDVSLQSRCFFPRDCWKCWPNGIDPKRRPATEVLQSRNTKQSIENTNETMVVSPKKQEHEFIVSWIFSHVFNKGCDTFRVTKNFGCLSLGKTMSSISRSLLISPIIQNIYIHSEYLESPLLEITERKKK